MSIRGRTVFLVAAVLARAVLVSPQQCGITATIPKEYVAHGHTSLLGQWPWHGALFHRINRAATSYACGVTVVSNFYTLTAAHCTFPSSKVRTLNPNELLIRLGIANLEKAEHSQQQFTVKEIIRHEEYNTLTVGNDITLLKVTNEIEFNAFVRPICFWNGDDSLTTIVGKKGYSPGWGLDEHGSFAKELKYAVMPVVSREQCRSSDPNYYTHYLYGRKAFCAGSRNGTSVSNGDSGGGLYIQVDNVWYLRGIVSNGKLTPNRKHDASNYVVYTDVAHYLPWLQQTLDITISDEKYAECGVMSENAESHRPYSDRRPWPWYGEVYRNGSKPQWLGDVAIINKSFVLSQAAIFTHSDYMDPSRLVVVFKSSRIQAERILRQVQVKAIIPFRNWALTQKENNIALLEIVKPLIYTDIIRPICLWKGDTAFSVINGSTVVLGRAKSLPLPGRNCARIANSNDAIPNSLCFGATKKEYVRMFGGIMFLQYNGKWFARGISYTSAKSGRIYLIYLLDVALYTRWIEQTIAERSEMLIPLSTCTAGSSQEWNVRLHSNANQCYGSLITSYLVLTTASCIVDFNHLDRKSILRISNSHRTEIVNVTDVYKHPFFHETHFTHNIALVHIENPFNAEPICISQKPTNPGKLFFTSWQLSRELNQTLSLVDTNDCNKMWIKEEIYVNLEGGHICGQLRKPSSEFNCQEDLSGSPLTYQQGGKHFLQGILDFGKNDHCASGGLPEGFLNVTFYSSWIYEVFEKVRNDRSIQESPVDDVDQYENFNELSDMVLPHLNNIGYKIKSVIQQEEDVTSLVKRLFDKFKF